MGKTSDEITGKVGKDPYLGTRHPPSLNLEDLSIRVNLKVTEEVMHHAGL
jgi:hypothetical protein